MAFRKIYMEKLASVFTVDDTRVEGLHSSMYNM